MRLSIPIKVLFVAGLSYCITLLLLTAVALHFDLNLRTPVMGVKLWFVFWAIELLVSVSVATIATYYFLDRPLIKLTQTMAEAGEGDFLIRAPVENEDELGHLAHSFNRMLARLTDLQARKIEVEQSLIITQEELKYKKRLEEKGRLIEKTNRLLENLVKDLSSLYEIGQGINQTLSLDQLYQVVTDVLKKQLRIENFSLMTWDEKHHLLRIKAAFGFADMKHVMELTLKNKEGVAGEVMHSGKTIYVGDVTASIKFTKRNAALMGSILSIPLRYKGETLGVANFGRARTHAFSGADVKMLTLVTNQIALSIANARLYTQTRELSVTDELTGVFNRRHFGQVVQLEWKRAVRFKRDLSLLMIDVDYFKRYNDTHGHPEGDIVLKKLGELLNTNLREVDTVARFGGEEFIILLPDTDKRGAIAVAEKLRHLVQEKINPITISVGVASYPDDVREVDDLIDHADIALYDAKDRGRNQVHTYMSFKEPTPAMPTSGEEKKEPSSKTRLVH